ncbi:MAG: FecCD family ABC transporter permease [Thermodesulfobacteriota bacterium]
MTRTWLLLVSALAALVLTAAGSGAVSVVPMDTVRILGAKLMGRPEWLERVPGMAVALVWDVRLPRIATALAVGGALSLSGAVFQGVLRNPLADSYTLGVSAGGALGACLCLLTGFTAFGALSVPAWALAGSAVSLTAVLLMARAGGGFDAMTLVLAGVMVAATLQAAIGFVKFLAGENVAGLVFWLMGGLSAKTWAEAGIAWAGLALGLPAALFLARDLDAMCLGDEQARALGVPVSAARLALLCAAAAMTAACVAVSGIIGFVGLIVPHIVRIAAGPSHGRLLPLSVLGGMLLLLGADTASRTLLPHEAPVGVLTAMLGGPYFCWLFMRGRANA